MAAAAWGLAASLGGAMAGGCEESAAGSGSTGEPGPSFTVQKITQSAVDKIDLLLVIDNSASMADKQEIFQKTVPDLVRRLVNPRCVDESGQPLGEQAADPLAPCPTPGAKREFEPILDIHIGVVSSSLGGHGSDQCTGTADPSQADMAHLVTRGVMLEETYESKGFLVWDPDTKSPSHNPQGLTDIDQLIGRLGAIVVGTSEKGCGYEAQLEAWYRFLVEPDPYERIEVPLNKSVLVGTDAVVLEQRKAFLRPDSLLAIVLLTDENDCSIRDVDDGQYFFVAQADQNKFRLPKPRAACATDPESPCCRSCGQTPGEGCDWSQDDCCVAPCGDPTCKPTSCQGIKKLTEAEDDINLRCWDQKRRFGIDFLWPIDRYVSGLQSAHVEDRFGNLAPNPLYYDLDPNDDNSTVRDPSLVFFAGIVGVPWQDIARRDANGKPDTLAGLDLEGKAVGGLQTADELAANKIWDLILGDPSCYTRDPAKCRPADPLMIESPAPRTGTGPITGALAPPGAGYYQNPVNGHEWNVVAGDDLQYACIFPLATPRDCTVSTVSCDCRPGEEAEQNPLCQDPSGAFGNTQFSAKAYPSVRELQLLKAIGSQGIVASICPAQTSDANLADFGYRPAVGAVVERLQAAASARCFARSLGFDENGSVGCSIIEAVRTEGCSCVAPGRAPLSEDELAFLEAIKADPLYAVAQWSCFCAIPQLEGGALQACQQDLGEPANAHGWCYIDANATPPLGNPGLVAKCPASEKRIVRFVGAGQGQTGATLFIGCRQ
jgi:hypothetical protein